MLARRTGVAEEGQIPFHGWMSKTGRLAIMQGSDPLQHVQENASNKALSHFLRWIPRVALGLFILAQVAFILLFNSRDYLLRARNGNYNNWKRIERNLGFQKSRKLSTWLDYSRKVSSPKSRPALLASLDSKSIPDQIAIRTLETNRWWASGLRQGQWWALFAPNVSHVICFPAVELRWDLDQLPQSEADLALKEVGSRKLAPIQLLSVNEPHSSESYLRFGRFRLRRLESALTLALAPGNRSFLDAARKEGWNDRIRNQFVIPKRRLIHAYLRWRMREYLQTHPELPRPTQVRLLSRTRSIVPPSETGSHCWKFESEIYLARWIPYRQDPTFLKCIEPYNVTTGRFWRR